MAGGDDPSQDTATDERGNLSPTPSLKVNQLSGEAERELKTRSNTEDRSPLIYKARSFLQSPQVSGQDLLSKRQFLREKGLHEAEIDMLLREPPSVPLIPPRTYPQLPPSDLPNLLLGLSRLFSWIAGGSALLIFIYYRFLLPRISSSFMARHTLRSHHLDLMRRLTTSLSTFKAEQAESWSVLPKTDPWKESSPFSKCSCMDDIQSAFGEREPQFEDVSPVTILRCSITDLTKGEGDEKKPTTEEIFRYSEERIPWLLTTEGRKYQERLWEALVSCPLFTAIPTISPARTEQDHELHSRWSYSPPLPRDLSPVIKSLVSLKLALPRDRMPKFQSALETLSEFTGYLSSQIYMPYRPPTSGVGIASNLTPIEEQLRREIRALKGLVLNRRSFLPPTRSSTIPAPVATTA